MLEQKNYHKIFFLFLSVVIGIIILKPSLNFQPYLAQGDHGRDLYAFKKTMEGALPYRDYSWPFGPLMPYYYAIFYKLFGTSVQSVLLGQNLLILLSGIFIYLICLVFIPPVLSFIAALWYWGFRGTEFFYTYTHNGGILTLLIVVYCLVQYIKEPRLFYVYGGSLSLLLFMFIRLNIGLASLVSFFTILTVADYIKKDPRAPQKRYLYGGLSLFLMAAVFLIYWFLLHPLPNYAIHQSLPYAKSDRADNTQTFLDALFLLKYLLITAFTGSWPRRIFGVLLFLFFIRSAFLMLRNEFSQKLKINTLLAFFAFFLCISFNLHEFLLSGVFYRLNWVTPIAIIAFFYLIGMGTYKLPSSVIKGSLFLTLFLAAFLSLENQYQFIQSVKKSGNLLNIGKNHVYTLQSPDWFKTVKDTVAFIEKNVSRDEKILAVPFDPLYNFLTGRDSPTRQLIFFDHTNVTPPQEREVIAQLEKKKVNFIIISSRSDTREKGMGTFGKTYCPLLAKYIDDNFKVITTFGDWENPPGWAWNHGTKIFKRTSVIFD